MDRYARAIELDRSHEAQRVSTMNIRNCWDPIFPRDGTKAELLQRGMSRTGYGKSDVLIVAKKYRKLCGAKGHTKGQFMIIILMNKIPNIKIIKEEEIISYLNKGFLILIYRKCYAIESLANLSRGITTISSELSLRNMSTVVLILFLDNDTRPLFLKHLCKISTLLLWFLLISLAA